MQLSQEEFTRRDWSQPGLVPRIVDIKRFEKQVAGTCSKNSNQFEFVGLVAGTKAGSLRLNFEAEIARSRNGPGLVPTACCRDQSPPVCHTSGRRKGGLPTFTAFE